MPLHLLVRAGAVSGIWLALTGTVGVSDLVTSRRFATKAMAAFTATSARSTWVPKQPDPLAIGADGRTVGERLELLKEAATAAFRQGKLGLAIEKYSEMIAQSPGHHMAYSNRSACHCAQKEYRQALDDALKCTDLMPAWGKGYVRKGAALHGMYRWKEAIEAYEAGLRMEPELAALHEGLADARRRRARAGGDWESIGLRKVADPTGREESLDLLKLPQAMCPAPRRGICVVDGYAAGSRLT
mgnify:FL=1